MGRREKYTTIDESKPGAAIAGSIRSIRQGRGLSQAALAPLIGVSSSYLSRLENGEIAHPHESVLQKIKSLGVDVEAIESKRVNKTSPNHILQDNILVLESIITEQRVIMRRIESISQELRDIAAGRAGFEQRVPDYSPDKHNTLMEQTTGAQIPNDYIPKD